MENQFSYSNVTDEVNQENQELGMIIGIDLLSQREQLKEKLKDIAGRLADDQLKYNQCIADLITVNSEIRKQNIDTTKYVYDLNQQDSSQII